MSNTFATVTTLDVVAQIRTLCEAVFWYEVGYITRVITTYDADNETYRAIAITLFSGEHMMRILRRGPPETNRILAMNSLLCSLETTLHERIRESEDYMKVLHLDPETFGPQDSIPPEEFISSGNSTHHQHEPQTVHDNEQGKDTRTNNTQVEMDSILDLDHIANETPEKQLDVVWSGGVGNHISLFPPSKSPERKISFGSTEVDWEEYYSEGIEDDFAVVSDGHIGFGVGQVLSLG